MAYGTFANWIGGGTSFSGRASYDTGVFTDVAQDVSDIISMISPFETPFLALIGDADNAAQSVQHEWMEDALNPNSVTLGVSTNPNTGNVSSLSVNESVMTNIMIGSVMRYADGAGGEEYIQVEAVTSATVFQGRRGFAGTNSVTIPIGATLTIIAESAMEGADVTDDLSKARVHKFNHCQIFKKDLIISGTTEALRMLGGITSEKDHQIQQRTREALRDLEKAVFLSRASATVGGTATTRTFRGLRQFIATNNVTSVAIGALDVQLTSLIKKAWDNGGSDVDLIICGPAVKEKIDGMNNSYLKTSQAESEYRRVISVYEGTYGRQEVVMSRWMPSNEGLIIAKDRVKVVPLSGRSFHYEEVAKTGDATKGMILGEYTLVCRNEEGMSRFSAY